MTDRWMTPANILVLMDQADHATTSAAFDTPRSFAIGDPAALPQLPAGYATTPIARYRSHAQFLADINLGSLAAGYRYALYDPEAWPDTPDAEQNDPWRYLQLFGQLAMQNGIQPVMAPARDLALAPDPEVMPRAGESITAWYLRAQIAWNAADHGFAVSIQSQGLISGTGGGPSAYASFVDQAGQQARLANPYVVRLAGLSTMRGTAQQNIDAAAAAASTVGGWWLNAGTADIDKAVQIVAGVS
jgi:hypothetical protein